MNVIFPRAAAERAERCILVCGLILLASSTFSPTCTLALDGHANAAAAPERELVYIVDFEDRTVLVTYLETL
ncbi:MAG: hypothetical protein K0S65_826 [Labilithrix sp.]|nr:hypothetical protein [Labilithrix sp.]